MIKINSDFMSNYNLVFAKNLISIPARNLSRASKKHELIITGACRLFFKKGFDRTTMRQIASECGMSLGQIYHYISCKDDILFLVVKNMHERWYQYLMDLGLEKINDPIQVLEKAICGSIEFHAKNKKLVQFIYSETKHLSKKHLNYVLQMDNRNIIGFFKKVLEMVNDQYPIDFDLDFASRLLPFIIVFIGLRGWNLKKWSLDESINHLSIFILKGLGLFEKERN